MSASSTQFTHFVWIPTASASSAWLGAFLQQDGTPVWFFDNCSDPQASIDRLGADLGQILAQFGSSPVDVVAYSMGGLIVRAYLTGLNSSNATVNPPAHPSIRKLVFIATPHFGTGWVDLRLTSKVPKCVRRVLFSGI